MSEIPELHIESILPVASVFPNIEREMVFLCTKEGVYYGHIIAPKGHAAEVIRRAEEYPVLAELFDKATKRIVMLEQALGEKP